MEDPDGLESGIVNSSLAGRVPPLGSVLSSLLAADKREVSRACLSGNSNRTTKCLEYLLEHVKCLSNNEGTIVPICVPLLDDTSNRKKVLLIMEWLIQSDDAWQPVIKTLAHIIRLSDFDRSIKLECCLVVRELINNSISTRGRREVMLRVFQSATIFGTCVSHLVELVCDASVKDGNKIVPTRFTIAAADCMMVITKVLASSQDTACNAVFSDNLENILSLLSELYKWNSGTRPLHARGLMRVQIHLRQISGSKGELAVRNAVLRTCWLEYVSIVTLDVHKVPLLSQIQKFLTGLQHNSSDAEKSGSKMRCFFLTCLALFLGRLDAAQLNSLSVVNGDLLHVLWCQLSGNEEETTEIAVAILRFLLFEHATSSDDATTDFLSMAIEILNTRERISTSATCLIAEYFLHHPLPDLQALFLNIDSENACQRQNAIDVIEALLQAVLNSDFASPSSLSHSIANQLLKHLQNEELIRRTNAFALFVKLDPAFLIPALTQRLYDSSQKVQKAAGSALLAVLKCSSQQALVVSVILDCARNISLVSRTPKHPGEIGISGSTKREDVDQIMSLLSSWASTVKDWQTMAVFLLDKMFGDPSNPMVPRFLSEISSLLADVYQVVFARTLQEMLKTFPNMEQDDRIVFRKLSPLLILRILPLNAYDHIDCKELYNPQDDHTVASMLIEWMCTSEFDDVRKLSAELSGRVLPGVLLPLVTNQLERAVQIMDCMRLKTCLYSICSSLLMRGHETIFNPLMRKIRIFLATVLLWPTSSEDVQKAQHGCIDCFAMMICAEVNTSRPTSRIQLIDEGQNNKLENVLNGVISCLQNQPYALPSLCGMSPSEFASSIVQDIMTNTISTPVSFRVCMANVLISSSSKIPPNCDQEFSSNVLPAVLALLKTEEESIVRAACIQILFTEVYKPKDAAFLAVNARYLLDLSLNSLSSESALPEEKLAGAKLLASLLVHESVVENMGSSLVRVLHVLSKLSRTDCSPELRKLCERLWTCLSS